MIYQDCSDIERAIENHYSVDDSCEDKLETVKFAKATYSKDKIADLVSSVLESIKRTWPAGTKVKWRKLPEITEHEVDGRKMSVLTCRIGKCVSIK